MVIIEQKDYTVGDLIEKTNQEFYYTFLEFASHLNLSRSLEINTLLLNGTIASLYFPAYNSLLRSVIKDAEKREKLFEQEIYQERIFGIMIFISLKFRQKNEVSWKKTDAFIDDLKDHKSTVKNFFILNVAPEEMKLKNYDKFISEINSYYRVKQTYLPDLFFDPSFKSISESSAIKQLFMAGSKEEFLEKIKTWKYLPDPEILDSFSPIESIPFFNPLNINPRLQIANRASVYLKMLGITFFGSSELIDDIIDLFTNYFIERLPSKEDEIYQMLLCFGVLMKMLKGSGHSTIRWKTLLEALSEEVDAELAENFLNTFFMLNQDEDLSEDIGTFDFKSFIQEYNEFLKYAGYLHYGVIHTGVFLVWRALIKYLEELQREDEFRRIKGGLFENWVYEITEKYNFASEKIILRNTKKPPSEKYLEMKSQIADFKKEPLEFKIPFPDKYDWGAFLEIDLAFKVEDILIAISCKGTSVPWSVELDIFKWFSNFKKNKRLLDKKTIILEDCIKQKLIDHPFFHDISRYSTTVLKTEGIIGFAMLSPEAYEKYLMKMREAIDSGTINNFLVDQMIDFTDEEDVKKKKEMVKKYFSEN